MARNWVEDGWYGHYQAGKSATPDLAAAFPVVVPVALSFRLFGVGVWQGRLAGVVFDLFSLVLWYYLVNKMFNRRIAWATLIFIILLPGAAELSPILASRQVLGEMPSIFYLLGGYACLWLCLERKWWAAIPMVFLWGIAVRSKSQVYPFWLISLFLPSLVFLFKRRKLFLLLFAWGLGGTWLALRLIAWMQTWLLSGRTLEGEPVSGLYGVTAFVNSFGVRQNAMIAAFTLGLPVLLGLILAFWLWLQSIRRSTYPDASDILKLVFLCLAGSWFGWYATVAMFWIRYLLPGFFFGSVFAASLFDHLTQGFNLRRSLQQAAGLFIPTQRSWSMTISLLALILLGLTLGLNTLYFYLPLTMAESSGYDNVVDYINQETSPDALIESYESELFFLLERRYHFPQDEISVELIRRGLIDAYQSINYDPLNADPDYLVVGRFSRKWGLYDRSLQAGPFRLIKTFSDYQVYQRIR